MINQYLSIALHNLSHRKLRTILTVLGIVIGVAAIVSLVLIGQSLEYSIEEQFEMFGANRIYVMMKGMSFGALSSGLTDDDVEVLDDISEIKYVNPYFMDIAMVEYGNEEESMMVVGFEAEDAEKRFADIDFKAELGRYFQEDEKNVIMVGHMFLGEIFDKEIHINNNLKIKGQKFRIVGVFEAVGNAQDDSSIYMPLDQAQDLFDKPNDIAAIELIVKEGTNIDQVVKKVERRLERHRNEEDFDVITPEQLLEQFNQVMLIIQLVLVSIAGISLVVGALGIMNSMYTNVLERTKEIGIMKAVGAQNKDILLLFMLESGFMGLVGGIIGISIGVGAAYLVELAAASAGYSALQVHVGAGIIIFALLFAFGVGVLAGTLPARQAAKLKPTEAFQK